MANEHSPDIDKQLSQIEREIDQTKNQFEQYFAGVLKKMPVREQLSLQRVFQNLSTSDLKSTPARFRYSQLKARFNQLNSMWTKTLKQIEEGTYQRHLKQVDMHSKAVTTQLPAPVGARSEKPAPSAPASSSSFDKIYTQYAGLLKDQKVPSKDAFVKAMDKQMAEFKKLNPNEKVEIKLSRSKDGKVAIKIQKKK